MFKLVVLSVVLALAAAKPSAIAPWGLGYAGLAAPLAAPLVAAPYHASVVSAPVLGAYNYRGPLSLGPGQPANIVAADGRPLDTISVNLDRAAHYTARAVDAHGVHLLKKRSAPLVAPAAWSHAARIDWPVARLGAPLAAPLAVAPWGNAALGHAGVWGHAGLLAPGVLGHGALGHLW